MGRPKRLPGPKFESSSDDSFSSDDEYYPNHALPVVLERPSTKLPTPNRYRIITRELNDHGEGSYILQPLPSKLSGEANRRTRLPNGNGRSTLKSKSKSTSKSATPSLRQDAKRTLLRVPLTKIYQYVSPAQLESFEHNLARNPLLDPYMRRLFERSQAEYDFLNAQHAAKLGPAATTTGLKAVQGAQQGQIVLPERKHGRLPKKQRTGASPMEKIEAQIQAEAAVDVNIAAGARACTNRSPSRDKSAEVSAQSFLPPFPPSQPAQHEWRSSLLHPLPYESPIDEKGEDEMKGEEEETWEVEGILEDAVIDGEHCFLVKWVGFSEEDATWEQKSNLKGAMEIVEEYLIARREMREEGIVYG